MIYNNSMSYMLFFKLVILHFLWVSVASFEPKVLWNKIACSITPPARQTALTHSTDFANFGSSSIKVDFFECSAFSWWSLHKLYRLSTLVSSLRSVHETCRVDFQFVCRLWQMERFSKCLPFLATLAPGKVCNAFAVTSWAAWLECQLQPKLRI